VLPGTCTWKKRADDAGFTLVEILVASAIMFFVATALFGLVSTSTLLSVTAKADAVAVNAANSFLEQVRRLAYADVTQTRVNTLARASSRTIDGITVSVTATVTPQWFAEQNRDHDDSAYKHVSVTVRATPLAGRPFVLTTGTFVSNLRTTDSAGTGPGPNVELTAATPRAGAVWGSVPLGMSADSGDPGAILARLEITAGGAVISEKFTSEQSDSLSVDWNTAATNVDGTPRFPDGTYVMRAKAWNDRNQLDQEIWSLTVDNHPPDTPGTPTVRSTIANTAVIFGWSPARDGSDWVRDYLVEWQIQSATGPSFSTLGTPQTLIPADPTSLVTWTGNTTALSRYRINVTSRGPVASGRTPPQLSSQTISATFISRPSLAGSTVNVTDAGGNNRRAILNLNLMCDAPGFGTTGVTTYRWQYRYGPAGTWIDLPGATTRTHTGALTAPTNGFFRNMGISFRCLVTVTPAGGTQVAVPSCVVPFTRGTGTGSATAGSNDWGIWMTPPASTPAIGWGMWGL